MQTKRNNMIMRIQALGVVIPENYCYSEDKNKKSIDRQYEQALAKAIASVKDEKNVERNAEVLKTLLDYLTLEVMPFQDPPRLQLVILHTLQDMLTFHEKNWNDGLAFTLWDFCETHSGFFEEKIIEQFIECASAHQDPELLQRIGLYLYHKNSESKSQNKDKQAQALLCLVLGGKNNLKVHCYEHFIDMPTDLNLSSLAALVQKLEKHKQTALYFKILQTPVITSLEQQARINVHAANELSEIFYHAWLLSENESQENITYYFIQTLSYTRHAMRTNDESVVRSVVDRVVKIYEWLHPEELEDPLADTIVKASQECLMTLNNMMPAVRALHSFYFGSKDKKEEYEIIYRKARELESKQIRDRKVDDETKEIEVALEESKGFSQNTNEKATALSGKLAQCQKELRIKRTKGALFDCISDSKNLSKVENGFWGIYSLWNQLQLEPYEISIFSDLLQVQFDKEEKDNLPFTPTLAILFTNIPAIKNKLSTKLFNNIMQHGLEHFDELTVHEKNKVGKWDEARRSAAAIETANRNKARNKRIRNNFALMTFFGIGLSNIVDLIMGKSLNTTAGWFSSKIAQPVVTAVNKFNHPDFYQSLDKCRTGDMQACAQAAQYAYSSTTFRFDFIDEVRQSFDLDYFGDKAATSVRDNDLEALKTLRTINPEILQHRKDLLLIAAKNPDAAFMTEFLYHNHYPVDQTTHQETPLMTALRANNTAVAKVLVEKGASLIIRQSTSPLHVAIEQNNVEAVKVILTYNPSSTKNILIEDPNLLDTTIIVGNKAILSEMIDSGRLPINGWDRYYQQYDHPLVRAFWLAKFDIFDFLLQQGARIEKFVTWLQLIRKEDFNVYQDRMVRLFDKLFDNGLIFQEVNVAHILLLKAKAFEMYKLITLLLSKGMQFPHDFNLKSLLFLCSLACVDFRQEKIGTELAALSSILKSLASRIDFEDFIKELYFSQDVSPISQANIYYARTLAVIINAGFQIPIYLNPMAGVILEEPLLKSLEELTKLEKLEVKHSKEEPRLKGLKSILNYAAHHNYKSAVKEVLKTNLMNYETVKQAAIQVHNKHPGIYNLLRNHMRSMTASVVPQHYALYQPSPFHSQPMFSKESGRRSRIHR